ncbi:MAG: DUF86 domain-containing protein [Thermoanaerobaculia bacterium]
MSPGGVDRTVVRRHLLALDAALATLERHRDLSAIELAADRERLWVVERGLQLCAQNALDAATHLAASAGRDVPDYASAIDRLDELAILPHVFAERFRGIAGFRNVLVHGYLEVDLRIVEEMLATRLDDFREFARHVDALLES